MLSLESHRYCIAATLPRAPSLVPGVAAGILDHVRNVPRELARPGPIERDSTTVRGPLETLREHGRTSTELAISEIASLIMAKEAVPTGRWRFSLDMLHAGLELFRDPAAMGLPPERRAVIGSLLSSPVAAGLSLRELASQLGSGKEIFEEPGMRHQLAEFIRNVELALGQTPRLENQAISLEAIRSYAWERTCKAIGQVATLVWQEGVEKVQWRAAIEELIPLLALFEKPGDESMVLFPEAKPADPTNVPERKLANAAYCGAFLDWQVVDRKPLGWLLSHLEVLDSREKREDFAVFLYFVAQTLANYAIFTGDDAKRDVLHASHAFPYEARQLAERRAP